MNSNELIYDKLIINLWITKIDNELIIMNNKLIEINDKLIIMN